MMDKRSIISFVYGQMGLDVGKRVISVSAGWRDIYFSVRNDFVLTSKGYRTQTTKQDSSLY
jgi:hypothetical protein